MASFFTLKLTDGLSIFKLLIKLSLLNLNNDNMN